MDFIWESITEWLKEVLVGGIMDHLSGMFDAVNQQVGDVATQVEHPRRISRRGSSL